jgi:hypothetical protein
MWFYRYSSKSEIGQTVNHPVTLMTQFHVPNDPVRREEVKEALRRNATNRFIDKIVLLNERMYSPEELGVDDPKIEQRVIGHHLQFSDCLQNRPFGFLVFANNDIFLDDTIDNVRRTDLAYSKKMCALLRYESNQCLFGPRPDSNDTFIVHSNLSITPKQVSLFNFKFGQQGCDNKVCYLFATFGVEVVNDPFTIRTHHLHSEVTRKYAHPVLNSPYMGVAPYGANCPVAGINQDSIEPWVNMFDFHEQNRTLKRYLLNKTGPFCIPRVAGVENNTAFLVAMNQPVHDGLKNVMKRNAGICLGDEEAYSRTYFKAFEECDLYASWEPWGQVGKYISQSLAYVHDRFKKPKIGAFVFDIFHYVSDPWTHGLRGKKILIVSSFAEMMRVQPQAYDVDLFPECTLQFLKPPMTQADEKSRPWEEEFADFCKIVDSLDFDVALCSCGGYGNPLCAHIFSTGRSAIYVGGVLQLYFGIYGKRWLLERAEMMRLHMKPTWKRPIATLKPKGFETIESGCYW